MFGSSAFGELTFGEHQNAEPAMLAYLVPVTRRVFFEGTSRVLFLDGTSRIVIFNDQARDEEP